MDMGVRQKAYWLKQADAIKRQYVATVAYAIGLSLSDKDDHERAFDELELTTTKKDSKDMRSKATWDLLQFSYKARGGKGV